MATTIEDLHPDVLTYALRHLDGPTLASASCATPHLHSLSSHPDIWRDLCLSTWPSLLHPLVLRLIPSFPDSHRSFFSDAYPFPTVQSNPSPSHLQSELISAVDIYHNGTSIFSRVVETDTSTSWFQCSPFRIDALDRKDPLLPSDPIIKPDNLTLSWIVIDPIGRRAVNVSSRRPVSVDRHWYTGETRVRFGLVISDRYSVGAVVTCGGEGVGHVREVSLTVEDMDGICLNGRDSLGILGEAMGGGRRGRWMGRGEEEAKERYGKYVRRKRERKERKVRREWRLDMCFVGVGVLVMFLAFWVMVALR